MGILPLQFGWPECRVAGFDSEEVYDFPGPDNAAQNKTRRRSHHRREGHRPGWQGDELRRRGRIDTPADIGYFEHGGILQYVLAAVGGEVGTTLSWIPVSKSRTGGTRYSMILEDRSPFQPILICGGYAQLT